MIDRLLSARSRSVDSSGIRKVFDLGMKMPNPINLSIGQPDFPVPDEMKEAAIAAIRENKNGYTVTQGIPQLLSTIRARLAEDFGWAEGDPDTSVVVTNGTSGGILLALMALLDPGDEFISPDPYFVMYPQVGKMLSANCVLCDTYPDFRMTAQRVEPLITPRTKAVLLNSPSNPCGAVLTGKEVADLVDLCKRRGVLLISDEIYDEICYPEARENGVCPSPGRLTRDCLVIRGFGKSYGCTGWRLGYAAGPTRLIQEISKLQQSTFVCAPSPFQWGVLPAFDQDLSPVLAEYEARRQMVLDAFEGVAKVVRPGGAFYAFVEVPPRLKMTASQFVEQSIAQRVLVIPGGVFSKRDTHFRLSYAVSRTKLAEGLGILRGLMTDAAKPVAQTK
ncbi:MAG: aminotransferase class I/II-fold pyridoxal phosphate-dependent enzyme [Planctomycetes bacterium]|nr:aminotransferase class I/II-fold pyridoxal phosphate-dependent enzyme [Planctomycetota bacterium]